MPDPLKYEETETRTHSLCLFYVPGSTRTGNRCENCPGAARSRALYGQQFRCPFDILEPRLEHNIHFSPADAAANRKSETIDPKLTLASSSRVQHVADTMAKIGDISLHGSHATTRKNFRRCRSDPSIRNPNYSKMSVDIGVKRKADELERSLRNVLAEAPYHGHTVAVPNSNSMKGEVSLDIAEGMQSNKHLKLLQEPLVEGSDEILLGGFNSLSICSDGSAIHTQDEHHPERDMSICGPHGDIGVKLKAADILNQPENSLRTELAGVFSPKASVHTGVDERTIEFKDGSADVEERLRNKSQIIFQDLQGDEPFLPQLSWGVNAGMRASSSSLFNSSLNDGPNIMAQEDYHSALVSLLTTRIASIGIITEEQGVPPANDGIFNRNEEDGLIAIMQRDEIMEDSIDQIEERRIGGY